MCVTSLSTTVTARPQPASHSGQVRNTIRSSEVFFNETVSFSETALEVILDTF